MTDPFAAREQDPGRVTSEVATLLVELARLVKGRAFYPPGSRDLLTLFERAYRCWRGDLERHGPLEIQIDRHSIRAPGLDTPLANAQLGHLRDALGARQVVQLRFEPGLETEAFAALVELLAREPRRIALDGGFARALYRSAPIGIRVNDLDPESTLREEVAASAGQAKSRSAAVSQAATETPHVASEQPRLPMFAAPERRSDPAPETPQAPDPAALPDADDTAPHLALGEVGAPQPAATTLPDLEDRREEDRAPHGKAALQEGPSLAAPTADPAGDDVALGTGAAEDAGEDRLREADTLPDFPLPGTDEDRLDLDEADDLLAPATLSGIEGELTLDEPDREAAFDAGTDFPLSENGGQATLPDPDPFGGGDDAAPPPRSHVDLVESDLVEPDPFGADDRRGAQRDETTGPLQAAQRDETADEPRRTRRERTDEDPAAAPPEQTADEARAEQLLALLQELEESDDDALYEETAQRAAALAEKLVATGREEPGLEALLFFAAHAGDDAKRAEAQQAQAALQLERLASGTLLGCLVDLACPGSGPGDPRAFQVLTRLGAKVASELVRAAEVEPQVERREQLNALLVSMGEAVLPEVLLAMDAGQPDRARAAVRLARELAHPGAVDRLSQLLSSTDASLRQEAAKALARIADPRAIDALGIALSSDLEDLPTVAAFSLGACGSARAVEPLLHCLQESVQEGRSELARETIRALGRLGCAQAAPALAELLLRRGLLGRRKLRELKLAACSALGHLPGDEAVGALAQASHSRDEQLRRAAQTALERREHARRNA